MPDAAPRVSLLIPAYAARFFAAALDSALAQTYPNVEIIVADDSDGDYVEAMTTRVAKGPGRVRYVRNAPRRGFHANFAQLHTLAKGHYLKFLNDDDVLHPECVARMVAVFEALGSRISLVASRRVLIDEAGNALPDSPATVPLSEQDCALNGRMLGDDLLLASVNRVGEPTATMFRRADVALQAGSLFRIREHEYTCLADLALWLRLLARGALAYLAQQLSRIRIHSAQLQQSDEVAARCITERYYLPRDSRILGFLETPGDYEAALSRGANLVGEWLARPGISPGARRIFEEAQRSMSAQ
jgi:hypothetical protein